MPYIARVPTVKKSGFSYPLAPSPPLQLELEDDEKLDEAESDIRVSLRPPLVDEEVENDGPVSSYCRRVTVSLGLKPSIELHMALSLVP